jgi:hypothetical protein
LDCSTVVVGQIYCYWASEREYIQDYQLSGKRKREEDARIITQTIYLWDTVLLFGVGLYIEHHDLLFSHN